MNLWLGRQLEIRGSNVASQATTRGSGTRSVGNLESIQEYSSSETQFDTISLSGSNMEESRETSHANRGIGKQKMDTYIESTPKLRYNMELSFEFEIIMVL